MGTNTERERGIVIFPKKWSRTTGDKAGNVQSVSVAFPEMLSPTSKLEPRNIL